MCFTVNERGIVRVLMLGVLSGLFMIPCAHAEPENGDGTKQKINTLFERYHQRKLSLSGLFTRLNGMNTEAVHSASAELLTDDYRTLKTVLSRDQLENEALPALRSKLKKKRARLLSLVRDRGTYGRSSSAARRKKVTRSALALFTLYRKPLVYYMETHDETGTAFFRAVALIKYFRGHRRDPPPPSRRILERIDRARNILTKKTLMRAPTLSSDRKENGQVEAMNRKRTKSLSSKERKLVKLVNEYRAMFGLRKLIVDEKVTAAAREHSREMKEQGRMMHQSASAGRKPVLGRLENQGFRARKAGENVAKGKVSPMAVLKGWLKSPSHHRNLLMSSYRYIGVAREGKYWTLNMATVPRTGAR